MPVVIPAARALSRISVLGYVITIDTSAPAEGVLVSSSRPPSTPCDYASFEQLWTSAVMWAHAARTIRGEPRAQLR